MHLEGRDFDFLCSLTGLTGDKLLLLLEEDQDLLFEVLSEKVDHRKITDISFPLYIQMSICREAAGKPFEKNEKEYVVRSITFTYPKLHKESPYLTDRFQKNRKLQLREADAQYYLVLAGLFPERLELIHRKGGPKPEFYIGAAEVAFSRAGYADLAEHLFDWINVLNKIKVDKKPESSYIIGI
jgi:hypothetical protein